MDITTLTEHDIDTNAVALASSLSKITQGITYLLTEIKETGDNEQVRRDEIVQRLDELEFMLNIVPVYTEFYSDMKIAVHSKRLSELPEAVLSDLSVMFDKAISFTRHTDHLFSS